MVVRMLPIEYVHHTSSSTTDSAVSYMEYNGITKVKTLYFVFQSVSHTNAVNMYDPAMVLT